MDIFFRKILYTPLQIKKNTVYLHPLRQNGTIAQLVEQRTENPCVPGSIPGDATAKALKQKCLGAFFVT